MAFTEIKRGGFQGRKAIQNTVKIAPTSNCLKLDVSNDIYTRLGAPTFFKIMRGSGEHDGFIALVPRNVKSDATYKVHVGFNGRGLAKISVSANRIGVRKDAAGSLPFEITEDGLIVDVRSMRASPAFKIAAEQQDINRHMATA